MGNPFINEKKETSRIIAKEKTYEGIRAKGDITSIKGEAGRGWGAINYLPESIRVFGKQILAYQLSHYGGLRLWNDFIYKDIDIPINMQEVEDVPLILPWGMPQILNSCGTHVHLFIADNYLIFDFQTKNRLNLKETYIYQVKIPLIPQKDDPIDFEYYRCTAGFSTVVGIAGPESYCDWEIKPGGFYMRKSIRFFTHVLDIEPVDPIIEPEIIPDPIVDPEPVDDSVSRVVVTGSNLIVQKY